MKIMILEDSAERVISFYNMFNNQSLTIVNTAEDAINLVNYIKFDVIFLDHDLGERVYVDSEEKNTGYQVAKILSDSMNSKTPIIIHSWNPIGVKNMKNTLKNHKAQVVDIPFGNFDQNLLKFNNKKGEENENDI